ncbi:hypothetical protein IQ272_13760 [Chroococcidiopsidales cyanobacterium LEGE 13417]|uniref:hypothetical protein n=1 Tax=Chroococcidiopsis sp. CCALA 051 TaxID=869949 RepID=UPI0011B22A9A|nr:hypothetical protein [Chroococcidiopsis sp. CCALA 051]MBE9017183.1 hypothetical protein [Chroococcidiopsidales cyanobacterium LEGE 13417]
MMSENEPILSDRTENIDFTTVQQPSQNQDNTVADNTVSTNTNREPNLAKIGIGAAVGALVGAATVALASKVTVDRINNTVKGVGDAVKSAAEGVNNSVKNVGNAVKNVAENVNYTVNDVGTTIKGTAEDVNENVKGTVNAVKMSTHNAYYNVKGATDSVRLATEDISQNAKSPIEAVAQQMAQSQAVSTEKQSEQKQTAYVLVPVSKDKFVMQNFPVENGVPVIPREINIEQE